MLACEISKVDNVFWWVLQAFECTRGVIFDELFG